MGVRDEDALAKRRFFDWLDRHWHEYESDDATAESAEERQREIGVQRRPLAAAARLYAFKTLRGWLREWRQSNGMVSRRRGQGDE
jgi:hypothetical protein